MSSNLLVSGSEKHEVFRKHTARMTLPVRGGGIKLNFATVISVYLMMGPTPLFPVG